MEKVFKGFSAPQKEVLARKMGYSGNMQAFDMYLSENPDKSQQYRGYEQQAQKRLAKRTSFAEGGLTISSDENLVNQVRNSDAMDTTETMMEKPEQFTPEVDVKLETVNRNELLNTSSGQVGTNANVTASQAAAPTTTAAPTVTTATTQDAVALKTAEMEAAQATLSQQAQVQAQTMDPANLAQLGYSAEQIQQAQTVQAPAARVLEAGEAVSGSSVDMDEVNAAVDVQAVTADPTKKATVQGQLEGLMQQFEGGETPAWAAGAMRLAQQQLIARGLGASSIAGQAVIQAAMESALPIAAADAQTYAQFESQNLSNRQQAAMFGAEQRAKFLGMKFDQNFQAKVLNAAKISDIANMNFTASQQIALENAKMAQTVDLANLDARHAKMMGDMAAMSQMDMANLNNRQQSAVLNAQAFLQRDMAQFDADQQTQMFKAQSIIQSLFTDRAAENATRQFNATSKAQTDQFFAELASQVSMFNAAEKTDVATFNRQMADARDQFNASNRLIVDQSNAQWRRQVSLTNTAAINEANMFEARAQLDLTSAAYNNWMQTERDLYSFAYDSSEKELDRASQLAVAVMQVKAAGDQARGSALGSLLGAGINAVVNNWDDIFG